jgi:hypothetical protein
VQNWRSTLPSGWQGITELEVDAARQPVTDQGYAWEA